MSQKADLAAYKKAVRELNELSDRQFKAGIRDETPEYQSANARVLQAEKKIKKWRALAVYMFGR